MIEWRTLEVAPLPSELTDCITQWFVFWDVIGNDLIDSALRTPKFH